ncbi:hypothetical protein [Nesterenkonia suensis]
MTIQLVPQAEDSAAANETEPIAVPSVLGEPHPAVAELRDHRPELLDVSEAERDRALLILQAIASECE